MPIREYDREKDRKAARRIWREVGWLEEKDKKQLDRFLKSSRAWVATLNGEAECLVLNQQGTVRYIDRDLPLSVVAGVTTSRVARKQGLAGRLTAHAIAVDAAEGALVSALGMFEQGFYDQLGFGTGGYEIDIAFDPAQLRVNRRPRVPQRLTSKDYRAVHQSRLDRRKSHGAVNIHSAANTRAEMELGENAFGLGYFDGPGGALTHHIWLSTKQVEHGPYHVWWYSYQTGDQFRELLAVLKSLGDQVRLVRMPEPPGIQLQDFVRHPFRHRIASRKSDYDSRGSLLAYWQMRICDLAGCLAETKLPGTAVRFNLKLDDPIVKKLPENAPWRGIGGDYVVTLGPDSGAEPGHDDALPTLEASSGAFTRLWLGVRPATGLAISDRLSGPPVLLEELDWLLRLPPPRPGWDF